MKTKKQTTNSTNAGTAGNERNVSSVFELGDVVKFKEGLPNKVFGSEEFRIIKRQWTDESGVNVVKLKNAGTFSVDFLELVRPRKTKKEVGDSLFNCFFSLVNDFCPDECNKCPYVNDPDCMSSVIEDAVFYLRHSGE